jgi:hypothetical protein
MRARTRKSKNQLQYLVKLLKKTKGKVNKELQQRAEKETGLKWLQIYKWMFDRTKRASDEAVYKALGIHPPIFRVTG